MYTIKIYHTTPRQSNHIIIYINIDRLPLIQATVARFLVFRNLKREKIAPFPKAVESSTASSTPTAA
jgi:hypothetical protein